MRKPKLLWLNVLVFATTGLLTLIGVPAYALLHGFDGWQISAMVVGIVFCEMSITAGYHRLWSHRAYQAHWLVRLFFMIGGTFATQNSILHWCADHRRHHRYVDNNDKDPYSAKRGFWYAHIGWMLRDYTIDFDHEYKNCRDLQNDPIVRWQHRHYILLVLGMNFGIPLVLGLWHGDVLGMLLLLGAARLFIAHHFTFLINSLAHIWGSQPYSAENTARDNAVLAVLTLGEGYHNYHHCFQRDYRNGIHWWQFDPTKWLIRGLAALRLTSHLYRAPLERIEASRAHMLLVSTSRKLSQLPHAETLLFRLQIEYESLMNRINDFSQAKKQWLEASKSSVMENYDLETLKEKVESLKESFLQQKKDWLLLNAKIA